MKQLFVLFALLVISMAEEETPSWRGKSIHDKMKLQSTQVAEMTLSKDKDTPCLQRALCAVGASLREMDDVSVAKALVNVYETLKIMTEDLIREDPATAEKHFSTIFRTVESYKVGSTTKNMDFCDKLFECSSFKALEIVEDVKDKAVAPKATCNAVGKLCPGVSIGCAMCGLFLPGTCGPQCIVAGIYCGVSAYACKAE